MPGHSELHLITPASLEATFLWSSQAMNDPQAQLSEAGVQEAKNLNQLLAQQLGTAPATIYLDGGIQSIRTAHYALTPNERPGVNLVFDKNLRGMRDKETVAQVGRRMIIFANARAREETVTVAVAHPTAIRAMIARSSRYSESVAMSWLSLPPASDTTFVLTGRKWQLASGRLGVRTAIPASNESR